MRNQDGTAGLRHSDAEIERDRLVRLCYRLTGDPEAAEDLAQETLVRAWQHGHQLRDANRRDAWLTAIARNACRRWRRDRRPSPLSLPTSGGDGWSETLGEAEPADDFDLEIELERGELATLLDRAMAALPDETRQVLIERYVEGSPQAETALRLGLSEGAVAMRLQRGKLALRRVLSTGFPDDLADYGLGSGTAEDGWRTTRIWCPGCGQRRLEGIFVRSLGLFRLRCPACGRLNNTRSSALFPGTSGYRAALSRLLAWADRLYKHSLRHRTVPCPGCGTTLVLHKGVAEDVDFDDWRIGGRYPDRGTASGRVPLIWYYCDRCRGGSWNGQDINLLALPEGRRFWREHPRMRILPDREVEAAGRPAVVSGFESLTDRARLEIVYTRDTLDLIAIHGDRVGLQ